MKEINAYKCSYCDEIFSEKNFCRSHERKCRYNPSTRGCETCAFNAKTILFDENLQNVNVPFCIKNEDIAFGQKTACNLYKARGAKGVSNMIKAAILTCDIAGQISKSMSVPF